MPSSLVRSGVAILAGYAVFGVSAAVLFPLAGYDPGETAPWSVAMFSVFYGTAFAAIGGYVTAALAGRSRAAHAMVLAMLMAAGAILSALATPDREHWTQASVVLLMAPAAALGGVVRERRAG